ncbi:MAG: DUF2283 domain-containing protein [Elusimicrobiota bacterium]|jgi:uncharacterized protein YuzE
MMLPDGINVQIDPVSNVLYIKIRDAESVRTREEKPGVLVDTDERNRLVGISVIQPTKVTIERRKVFYTLAKKFHIPSISRIRPDHMAKAYAYA